MKDITITVDDEIAQWARLVAAELETSVSELVVRLLKEKMEEEREYEAAMKRDLARTARPLKDEGAYPSRDELHERSDLR